VAFSIRAISIVYVSISDDTSPTGSHILWKKSRFSRKNPKEALKKSTFVIPEKAGSS
jgi:hypothetical protein